MNLKQEFIKSIMQVLRLEMNIFTMSAIETIIERIEEKDYALFIAYLGERPSNYEKPIESIAKGVDEFYEKKIAPIKNSVTSRVEKIVSLTQVVVDGVSKNQNETREEIQNKLKINIEKLLEFKATRKNGGEDKLSNQDLEIIRTFGIDRFFDNLFDYNLTVWLKDMLLKPYTKPNIREMIQHEAVKETSKIFKIESAEVKKLLSGEASA